MFFSFGFPHKILENEGVPEAIFSVFLNEVYALREELHNGAACWMQVADLGAKKTSTPLSPFCATVSQRSKGHRRSQRKRRH